MTTLAYPTLTTQWLKAGVSSKQPKATMLVKVHSPARLAPRARVNVVFALDISGSMHGRVASREVTVPVPKVPYPLNTPQKNPVYPRPAPVWCGVQPDPAACIVPLDPYQPWGPGQPNPLDPPHVPYMDAYTWETRTKDITQLDRVKEAFIQALKKLDATDAFGVVVFNGTAAVLVVNGLATNSHKDEAIKKVMALSATGSTHLHGGWKLAMEQACLQLDPSQINTVLLLTDGQATDGIVNPAELAKHAATMTEHHITTSTFGVGLQFNEELLQAMAIAGGGRAYYVDEDSDVFAQEFNALTQQYGKRATLSWSGSEQVQVKSLQQDTSSPWAMPDPQYGDTQTYLLEVHLTSKKGKSTKKDAIIGAFTYQYYDTRDTKEHTIAVEWSLPRLTPGAWDALDEHPDVAKAVLTLEAAQTKEAALQALKVGDTATVQHALRGMTEKIQRGAYAKALQGESAKLMALSTMSMEGRHDMFNKVASYEAYSTRTGVPSSNEPLKK